MSFRQSFLFPFAMSCAILSTSESLRATPVQEAQLRELEARCDFLPAQRLRQIGDAAREYGDLTPDTVQQRFPSGKFTGAEGPRFEVTDAAGARSEIQFYRGVIAAVSYRTPPGDGYTLSFHQNGRLLDYHEYAGGKADGLFLSFNQDGAPKWIFTLAGGKLAGTYVLWDDSGGVKQRETLKEPRDFLPTLHKGGPQ